MIGQTALWPRAAVFDCDGLLVDSAACWRRAYVTVAREHGRRLDGLDLATLAGASVATAAATLSRGLGVRIDEQRLRRALRDSVAACPPPALPGAAALVHALAARMPLAVASNAPRHIVIGALEGLCGSATFDAVVSAEETAAPKPAPDVYLEACRRLGVATCDAVAFEDSPVGARAATRAGLLVVGVPSSPAPRLDADLVVGRLDDPQLLDLLRVRLDHRRRSSRADVRQARRA